MALWVPRPPSSFIPSSLTGNRPGNTHQSSCPGCGGHSRASASNGQCGVCACRLWAFQATAWICGFGLSRHLRNPSLRAGR